MTPLVQLFAIAPPAMRSVEVLGVLGEQRLRHRQRLAAGRRLRVRGLRPLREGQLRHDGAFGHVRAVERRLLRQRRRGGGWQVDARLVDVALHPLLVEVADEPIPVLIGVCDKCSARSESRREPGGRHRQQGSLGRAASRILVN